MSALLSLQGASVAFKGRRIVHDISMHVEPGEVIALLGPNGAGKTTLMRAALGLAPMVAGKALLGDCESSALAPHARALRAAYLPQRPHTVWPISVEDLVTLGRFAYGASPERLSLRDRAAVDAALASCAIASMRKRRMDEVSGGETVRAHLARALAQQAPLLVLDEPTAGLDPAQSISVGDILRKHASEGGAVLFSSHDISLAARVSDRIVLLKDGRVLSEGAPSAVLTSAAIQAAYGRAGRLERIGQTLTALFD